MLFHALNAQSIKPPVGTPIPAILFIPLPPVPAGSFVSMPIGMLPPAVPSAMINSAYVALQFQAASMVWDAITVGYGRLGAVALLTGGNLIAARRVRQFAASRARLLRTIYDWPAAAAPGPELVPEYDFVESSERRVISYLMGQTVAQRLAKAIWDVPRLFHRSLYGPFLPALNGALPLATGQSPDYLCFVPGMPGFCLVEAKGTNARFNPQNHAADLAKLNRGFAQLAQVPGALQSAVSVASFDKDVAGSIIVGQFWDPPNPNPYPVNIAGVAALTAEYFRRLTALLKCLAEPRSGPQPMTVVWNAASVGFRITMDRGQWMLLERLARGAVNELDFFNEISIMLAETADVDGIDGRNGDGLGLELIEFD